MRMYNKLSTLSTCWCGCCWQSTKNRSWRQLWSGYFSWRPFCTKIVKTCFLSLMIISYTSSACS